MSHLEIKQRVWNRIESDKNNTLSSFEQFLSLESKMGNERAAQLYYAGLLENLGIHVDMWDPDPEDMKINPNFMPCRDDYVNSPDVVGRYKGEGGGHSLMLSGHVDVVPEGELPWEHDPFKGKRENGKIYGRGAADMKGGLMANYMAVKAIHESGVKLKGDVILGSVIGEETGGAGTLSLISRGYRADAGIIPEPSDMKICPVSMGVIWFKITVNGKLAHAANAHLGVNAVSKATLIVHALDECNEAERMSLKHPLYTEVPNPFNINIGTIEGGSFPTSVPSEVTICGRIAFSPDEDVEEAKAVLEAAVARAAAQDDWLKDHLPVVEWYGFCLLSGSVDIDHPFAKLITEEYEETLGEAPEVKGTPWGTDAGSMIRFAGIPTIVFGPGPRETAHMADEYVDEEKLLSVAKVIAATILDWCEVAE